MTCQQCSAPCHGSVCQQCAIEDAYADQAAELRDERERDETGHASTLAQLRLAQEEGDLPDEIAARHDLDGERGEADE